MSTVSTVSTGSTGSTVSTVLTVSTVIARCYLHLRWYFFSNKSQKNSLLQRSIHECAAFIDLESRKIGLYGTRQKKCKTQKSFIQSGEGGEPTRCPWTAAFAVGAVALGSPAPCQAPVSPAAPRESLSSTTPDERQSESKEDHENHDTAAPVHVLDGENKDA